MKKFILIVTALFLASLAYTQSNNEEIDLIQAAFGMDKKAVVADFVKPSASQQDAFWQLYDEYETKRKDLGKQKIEVLKEYAGQYQTMTAEQADAWTKKAIELQKKTDGLIETYYGKIKAISDGIVATQFYQIEGYIITAIRMELLQSIPFVQNEQK